jgi:hypothetical protein
MSAARYQIEAARNKSFEESSMLGRLKIYLQAYKVQQNKTKGTISQ